MTYVEGRLAPRRAKHTALAVLALGAMASFGAGLGRNLIAARPTVAEAFAPIQDVPEAVAWVEPAPSGQTDAPPPVRLARAAPAAATDQQATVQVAAETLTPPLSADDLAVNAAATAPESPTPPPE